MATLLEMSQRIAELIHGFREDQNITQRRKRCSLLSRLVREDVWRQAHVEHPVAHYAKSRKTPEQKMRQLIVENDWVSLNPHIGEHHQVIIKLMLYQRASTIRVRHSRYGSIRQAVAPAFLVWIAHKEPERLKEAIDSRGNKRKALMFEIQAKYGTWGAL